MFKCQTRNCCLNLFLFFCLHILVFIGFLCTYIIFCGCLLQRLLNRLRTLNAQIFNGCMLNVMGIQELLLHGTEKFSHRRIAHHSTFAAMHLRLREKGTFTVEEMDAGRQRFVNTVENEEAVLNLVEDNHSISTRKIALDTIFIKSRTYSQPITHFLNG